MPFLGGLFGKKAVAEPVIDGIRGLVGEFGGILGSLTTTDGEKLDSKERLTTIIFEIQMKLVELNSSVLLAETNGNWLQRSWRPILMLNFGFIVSYNKFFAPAFGLPNTELDSQFWNLLEIGMGGYVIGRSVEKVTDKVTKNMDLSLLKKRDRKEHFEK